MYKSNKLQKMFSGESTPTYIICEVGINHNGSIDEALKLIESASKSGVDAVKFQKRTLSEIYSKSILDDSNSAEWNFDYLIPLLKDVELSDDDYKVIRKKCDELKLDLIITPFDEVSAEFIADLGVTAFKIASADMTNYSLIEKCSSYGLPIIISTGMWGRDEILKVVEHYKSKNITFALLHTQSTYPAPYESLGLKFIKDLCEMTEIVGYSGHERGVFIPIAAVTMGCKIIEKHITNNKEQKGPDHKASMLPEEWSEMIHNIRMLEKSLGGNKLVNQAEKLNKEVFAKSAIAKTNLKSGHILKKSDIEFKAPGKGLFPHEISDYYGKVLKRDIKAEYYISNDDFEDVLMIKDWDNFTFTNKWGVKCRFHDFESFDNVDADTIEFHCSDNDLDIDFVPKITPNGKRLIVHAPEIFNRELFDICSDDERKVNESKKILHRTVVKTMEIAKYFPNYKPKIVCHLGGMSSTIRDMDNTKHLMDNAIKNFEEFRQYKDIVDIMPENLPSRPWYFGGEWYQHGFTTAEDMCYFCNHFGITMTYDICHAFLYCKLHNKDLVEYTKMVMPIVGHIHISDAEGIGGEGLQIGEGELDFDGVFNEMKGFDFTWVTEIWSGHLHNAAGNYKALKLLEKSYSKII